MASREKAKNKSHFDKIIAKVETQYAGKNGLAKNTDVAKKSLAKSGIAMSVEEGESCESPTANVTIEGVIFPPCKDQTSLSGIVDNTIIDRSWGIAGGDTYLKPPDDIPYYIKPEICDNNTCYGLMISNVYGQINVRIGYAPASAIEVNSISDVKEEKASFIITALVKQLERINIILEKLNNEPSPLPDGTKTINMFDVWSFEGLLAHELIHTSQIRPIEIEPVLEMVKEKNMPKCRSKDEFIGKKKEQIKEMFKNSIDDLTKNFYLAYEKNKAMTLNKREFGAHQKQFTFLASLVKQIADKYHIPVKLPSFIQ